MKERIHTLIERIDAYFEGKNEREKYITMLFPAIIVLFLSYMYFFSASEKALKDSTNTLNQLSETNKVLKNTLGQMEQADTQVLLANKIKKAQQNIVSEKEKIEGIRAKAIDIEKSQKAWSQVLDFLSKKAKNDKLTISKIVTQKDVNSSGYDVFTIGVSGEASFKNVLEYLNSIESGDSFLRVTAGDIAYDSAKNTLKFDFNISAKRLKF